MLAAPACGSTMLPMAGTGVIQPPLGLIGRERECAVIDDVLDRALAGEAGALIFRGEAGIGKSALLRYAAERAAEMTVLRDRRRRS